MNEAVRCGASANDGFPALTASGVGVPPLGAPAVQMADKYRSFICVHLCLPAV
ncbi:hypothetical protein HW132_19375 [Brasilonema sp. CT11]|nr:hypothetical protein [Brasilonema sp. CT11]